jgi:hypothetical protein
MPTREKLLVSGLIENTGKQSLSWEPTANPDEFAVVLASGNSVAIRELRGHPEEGPDYVLTVRDPENRVIISIRNAERDVAYQDLGALYQSAMRYALKIDQTLDAMLKDLGVDEDIPF